MDRKYKVLYLTNIPSPYMVDYLNELGKNCNLTAIFERETDPTRPDSWRFDSKSRHNFQYVFLKGIPVRVLGYRGGRKYYNNDQALSVGAIRYISKEYDVIIVGNPCTPTGIISIFYMRLRGIHYTIQSEGGFPGDGKGLKERLKSFLMRDADLFFSTCDMDDKYFFRYGASSDRIRRYIFTATHASQVPGEAPSQKMRKEYKLKLGVPYNRVILSVGRVIPVKGFDILIEACKEMDEDTALYIVGGSKTEELDKLIRKNEIKNVVFVEEINSNALADYYIMADVFALATREDTWGLVINEAMLYGLPIVTTEMCVAGSALIEDGCNGYIVPINNSKLLWDKIRKLLTEEERRVSMGNKNYNIIKKYTIEKMGLDMIEHIQDYVDGEICGK